MNTQSIIIFKCQHIYHFNCADKEKTEKGIGLICPICSELEIEESLTTKKSLIMIKSKLLEDECPKKDTQGNLMSKNKQNLIKRFKRFDTKLKAQKKMRIESNLKDSN